LHPPYCFIHFSYQRNYNAFGMKNQIKQWPEPDKLLLSANISRIAKS